MYLLYFKKHGLRTFYILKPLSILFIWDTDFVLNGSLMLDPNNSFCISWYFLLDIFFLIDFRKLADVSPSEPWILLWSYLVYVLAF